MEAVEDVPARAGDGLHAVAFDSLSMPVLFSPVSRSERVRWRSTVEVQKLLMGTVPGNVILRVFPPSK